ncbi:hypothetical protein HOLleu_12590 [Holothuria leucospilota]|uniref:Sulfotransferase family protein n=1 Tax=Holothuria leucospilota TaxID=206669 RepID=A0A9Q1HD62_HOLLE|nr:hypothetical protein HOLleu_12590 [Holothuria leucospilota]
MSDIPRIFIWCWPRTVSTAVGKCLSNVDGVQFWFEPYQNCFSNEMHKIVAAPEEDPLATNPGYIQYMTKLHEARATSDSNKFFSDSKSYPQDKFV